MGVVLERNGSVQFVCILLLPSLLLSSIFQSPKSSNSTPSKGSPCAPDVHRTITTFQSGNPNDGLWLHSTRTTSPPHPGSIPATDAGSSQLASRANPPRRGRLSVGAGN